MDKAGSYVRLCVFVLIAASATAADFASDVYPVLQKAGCQACHNHDGVASGTRLKFPESDASTTAVNAFGDSLHVLVDGKDDAKSLLLLKPTLRVAHAGGKKIEPGSDAETVLKGWVEHLAKVDPSSLTAEAESHAPVGPVLRRLTHSQYNNTIRDLLRDDSRIADQFPPEDFVGGFRNQYQAQNTSPLLAEAYTTAAEKLAKKAFANGNPPHVVPCKPASAGDVSCRDKFIRTFGRKAFRRPLTAVESQRYVKLFSAATLKKGTSFTDGARIVVEAMLQSPNFLLRAENGIDPASRAYETASRLSYFIWNSMPDDDLLQSAAKGELATAEGVERATKRMLGDPKAREATNEFLAEWLRFDRLLGSVKDRRTYPQYTSELAIAMLEEPRRLFADLVWGNRNFMEFYSAAYAFVSSDLANLYGVPAPPAEYGRVELPAASDRAGILGQAMFLALTSKPAETSPTARGLFVREQFLCQEVPQPPPGVSTNLPALTKEKPQTTRERLAIHLNSESCATCHNLIDPIGLGFEKFDAIGQRREKQRITFRPTREDREQPAPPPVDLPLDTKGHVAGIKDSVFSSPRELGKILAGSTQCQECVVKQLFRFAAGRHETAADRVVIRKAYEDFRHSGFLFQELMVSLTKWLVFPPEGNESNGSGNH